MTVKETNQIHRRMNRMSELIGTLLVDGFHALALFAIGAATVWSAVHAFMGMAAKGSAGVDDILLLFIYLELGAMVGIYFKTNHMPVRFLIYVAMTALTRLLIGDVGAHKPAQWEILTISGAILLLALATLVVRYASARYPSSSASTSP
ncbi:MAG TPA: phosphate-starvation-inducible PsiE family protein [Burkholderiales bacterium]|nr:phosphate-starvation-inducible PsiE family protein [Burkholderiales bacterium]